MRLRSVPGRSSASGRVVLLVSALILGGCGQAVPTANSAPTFAQALARFKIPVPACQVTKTSFTIDSADVDVLGASFSGSPGCVADFLNTVDVGSSEPPTRWPYPGSSVIGSTTFGPTSPPFDPGNVHEFGWSFDVNGSYLFYGDIESIKGSQVEIMVSQNRSPQVVYLQCVETD